MRKNFAVACRSSPAVATVFKPPPPSPPLPLSLTRHEQIETAPPAAEHVWSGHSLPVTDVHCGLGGMRARVYTCSDDRTCKVGSMALLTGAAA